MSELEFDPADPDDRPDPTTVEAPVPDPQDWDDGYDRWVEPSHNDDRWWV